MTEIWFLGSQINKRIGSKLPSKREMLSVFFYHHITEKNTIRESATVVSDIILEFWNKAGIFFKSKKILIPVIEIEHKTWKNLKKSKFRTTKKKLEKQQKFSISLDQLFDISHPNAIEKMSIKEDKKFLLAQREPGRRGKIGSVDIPMAKKEKRKMILELKEKKNFKGL